MLISVAYAPGCTGAHVHSQSGCTPQTNFTAYTNPHGGTVICVGLLAMTLPSATTSIVPVTTCASAVQGIPVKRTLNLSVCSTSRARGPYPPAGVIDVTNGATVGDGTSLTFWIPEIAPEARLMIVLTMLLGLVNVSIAPPVLLEIRVAW